MFESILTLLFNLSFKKVKKATSEKEVIKTLLTDPDTGRTMSYAESRMRFG